MADILPNMTKLAQEAPPHPFYPLEANIVGYLANEWSVPKLLGVFFAGCAVELAITLLIVNRFNPTLRNGDKAALLWFVVCEYFGLDQEFWRLLTSFPKLVLYMSSLKIFWGPLSYTVAIMITTQHPLRYPLQALVSLGQIYGDVLYYATSLFDHYFNNTTYFRPEAYYFWTYYFFLNFIWIVIPGSECSDCWCS
ncbi:MAG: hypothetical protein Q9195_003249 [Heterodermia aff. obscurata]